MSPIRNKTCSNRILIDKRTNCVLRHVLIVDVIGVDIIIKTSYAVAVFNMALFDFQCSQVGLLLISDSVAFNGFLDCFVVGPSVHGLGYHRFRLWQKTPGPLIYLGFQPSDISDLEIERCG